MDPLSITAAVVSFVDIARRIKDSVDKVRRGLTLLYGAILIVTRKVGQTRQNLKQAVEDIIEELTELQKLCQDGQGRLDHIDLDSFHSLQKLHSSVWIPFSSEAILTMLAVL